MSVFRETAKDNRWDEHQRVVIAQAHRNRKAYQARVNRLVQTADSVSADAVLLPAMSFVHGAGVALADYYLPTKILLIAGALDLCTKRSREYGFAARDGVIVGEFGRNVIGRLNGPRFTVLGAISSTVKRLTRFPDEEPTDLDLPHRANGSPILLLDAGHHPYSDHYRRHTLRRAVNAIERRYHAPAAAVLASWLYVSSKPSPSWCVPEERGCFVRLIDMRQLHIVNHAHF